MFENSFKSNSPEGSYIFQGNFKHDSIWCKSLIEMQICSITFANLSRLQQCSSYNKIFILIYNTNSSDKHYIPTHASLHTFSKVTVTIFWKLYKGYRMVFVSICEHASSAFIFASTSSDNFLMRAASTLEVTNGKQRALRKFPASWNLSLLKRCFAPSNLADT